jgi:predicted DCC family thiol-disulfide oxidoreductase YuxK
MKRRGLALAPLQDPRVGSLLGLSQEELLRAICFVRTNGSRYFGVSAVLAVARELWWAWPLIWIARFPGMMSLMQVGYRWVARYRRCPAERCTTDQVASRR